MSKFGSLALVIADNPGTFLAREEAQAARELDGGDLAKVNRALVEFGYRSRGTSRPAVTDLLPDRTATEETLPPPLPRCLLRGPARGRWPPGPA